MKILVISAAYPPMHAGEATNTYHLCKKLAQRGVEVHVLTSRDNVGLGDSEIHVHPVMRDWDWAEMLRLRTELKSCSPDAVFIMYIGLMYHYHPMVTFAPTLCKRIWPHIPVVTRYESAFVGADPSRWGLLSRAFRKFMVRWAGGKDVAYSSGTLLRDSDAVVALCERHQSMMVEEWPPVRSKTALIPPPPNLRIAPNVNDEARVKGRAKLGLSSDNFVVSFFGYLYPIKGVDTLLRAFAKVASQRPQARLLFIGGKVGLDVAGGSSYFEEMQALAKELGIEGKTIWTGAFKSEEEEASQYLYASDACVLPFLEGVQLNNSSFASIMAHGLPTIVTRGPMMDTVFLDGGNVLTCEPRDVEAVAGHLLNLMDDREMRSRLTAGAIRFAEEWFSWETATTRTLELLSKKSVGMAA
ncbi:MAG: glycosyltransferase family 4 protein [Nitrospiraceae bacterium]|nr:glycosyltransferase family 4 protein [Nitrospiraceae bacterium]